MDKRSATVAFRTFEDALHGLQQIAVARETTVSDLMHQAALDIIERERRLYLTLDRIYGQGKGLQDLSGLQGNDGA